MILALLLGVVSGMVVDESSGAGVRKAEVLLTSGRQSQSAMTDAEGRFKFEGVTPGRYQVQVAKTGYEFREARGQGSKGWVEVGQGAGETGLRYLLRPLGLVAGPRCGQRWGSCYRCATGAAETSEARGKDVLDGGARQRDVG